MTESREDLEPLVTRCPHCSTRFRVSEAQLQVAKGRVRCGACLTVFVGIDHLQWDLEQDVAIANPKQSIDQLLGEIDAFELDEVSVPAATEPASAESVSTEPVSIEPVSIESVGPVVEIENFTAPGDLLDGFSPDIEAPQSVEVVEDVIEVDDKTVEPEPDRRDNASIEPDLPTNQALLEPAIIEVELPVDPFDQLSYETAREESITEPAEFANFAEAEVAQETLRAGDVQPDPEAEYAASSELPKPGLRKRQVAEPGEASTSMRPSVVSDLAAAVLEAPRRTRFQRWRGAMFIVAMVLIAAQVVWYLLPSWISDPEKRWLPEQVCEIAGCKLEPLRDLTQLLLTNVVVRVHPEHPEVRQIDLLLVNSGTFDQAFPDIEITFSTPAGDRVAWKRFTPVQYLAGDMKDATAIPRKTPVRISLEVTDPGTLAYSYEITLK